MGVEVRLQALKAVVRELELLLGVDGLGQLVSDIRASREAGRFVAVGGVDAALALYETRGNVAKARPLLSQARPGAAGASVARSSAMGPKEPRRSSPTIRPSLQRLLNVHGAFGCLREVICDLARLLCEQKSRL
ncbi:uncharacterized protein STAUR_4425 [Stigmatella aurantiaca DW4/3-1]|uniref:Uncharacterized protein n=1 Tax=Stigmatella aurantiaca (strain DW4/3-1) TaxID=378806 RepID=E3FVJ1_STIAD|nr:uncharacterized protein STAUR_4425 [Stigmatella aurantiaca DW4/3-1]